MYGDDKSMQEYGRLTGVIGAIGKPDPNGVIGKHAQVYQNYRILRFFVTCFVCHRQELMMVNTQVENPISTSRPALKTHTQLR